MVWTTDLKCSGTMWCQTLCHPLSIDLALPTQMRLETSLMMWVKYSRLTALMKLTTFIIVVLVITTSRHKTFLHYDSSSACAFRTWKQQTTTRQHLPMTPCWCSTMREAAPMQEASPLLTHRAAETKTTTVSANGAPALRNWLICTEEGKTTTCCKCPSEHCWTHMGVCVCVRFINVAPENYSQPHISGAIGFLSGTWFAFLVHSY